MLGAVGAGRVEGRVRPGWKTRPRTMPMATAISAVMANHSSVCPARRAALVTCRRLAMLAIGEEHQRRDDRLQQGDERAADGVEGAGQPVGRAAARGRSPGDQPRRMPTTRPSRTWAEKDAAETSGHPSSLPFGKVGWTDDGAAGGSTGRGRHPAVVERAPAREAPQVLHSRVKAAGTAGPSRMCGEFTSREGSSGSGCLGSRPR